MKDLKSLIKKLLGRNQREDGWRGFMFERSLSEADRRRTRINRSGRMLPGGDGSTARNDESPTEALGLVQGDSERSVAAGEQLYQNFIRNTRDRMIAASMAPYAGLDPLQIMGADYFMLAKSHISSRFNATEAEADWLVREWMRDNPLASVETLYGSLTTGHYTLFRLGTLPYPGAAYPLQLVDTRDVRASAYFERYVADGRSTSSPGFIRCTTWMRDNWGLPPEMAEQIMEDFMRDNRHLPFDAVYGALADGSLSLMAVAEHMDGIPDYQVKTQLVGEVKIPQKPQSQAGLICRSCANFVNYTSRHSTLICAMHPYGPDGQDCFDWEAKQC